MTVPSSAQSLAELTAWFEAHPSLISEGSAVDNAIRLLDHAYTPDGTTESELLSASTLIWLTDDGGEHARNGFVYRGRNHGLAARLGIGRH